jgi:hypothetical protein
MEGLHHAEQKAAAAAAAGGGGGGGGEHFPSVEAIGATVMFTSSLQRWGSWRGMLLGRPRVRTDGVYLLKTSWFRAPYRDMFHQVDKGVGMLETCYWRVLRFEQAAEVGAGGGGAGQGGAAGGGGGGEASYSSEGGDGGGRGGGEQAERQCGGCTARGLYSMVSGPDAAEELAGALEQARHQTARAARERAVRGRGRGGGGGREEDRPPAPAHPKIHRY